MHNCGSNEVTMLGNMIFMKLNQGQVCIIDAEEDYIVWWYENISGDICTRDYYLRAKERVRIDRITEEISLENINN